MQWRKIRILGSGFTEEEYKLYNFDDLDDPNQAMQYLSNWLNDKIFRPLINSGFHKHVLEDKWVTNNLFCGLGIPTTKTYGLFHPSFGVRSEGGSMTTCSDVIKVIDKDIPCQLFLKPRGGRQGRNLISVSVYREEISNEVMVSQQGEITSFNDFLNSLPASAFDEYDGSYHGWLIQSYIKQHEFMVRINPYTVNTFRIVTLLNFDDEPKVCYSLLRFGRQGGVADNWSTGGIAVVVDPVTGALGEGIFRPKFGGQKVTRHPDTDVLFEGLVVPDWDEVLNICKRAAILFSGVKSIGWDVAITPDGPVIIEGNADWGVPSVQVHIKGGCLTKEYRDELSKMGADFPTTLVSIPSACLFLFSRRWRQSRWPKIISRVKKKLI